METYSLASHTGNVLCKSNYCCYSCTKDTSVTYLNWVRGHFLFQFLNYKFPVSSSCHYILMNVNHAASRYSVHCYCKCLLIAATDYFSNKRRSVKNYKRPVCSICRTWRASCPGTIDSLRWLQMINCRCLFFDDDVTKFINNGDASNLCNIWDDVSFCASPYRECCLVCPSFYLFVERQTEVYLNTKI